MRTILAALTLLAAGTTAHLVAVTAAHAEIDYPWCIYGGDLGASGECMYSTREQCQASVFGRWNQYCDLNRWVYFEQQQRGTVGAATPVPGARRR